jgi:Ca2+-dependent lipid-binding protein
LQAKDLPAADETGSSDPYLRVWDMAGEPKMTKIVKQNTNPLYYEVLELSYEVRSAEELASFPPIIIDVLDHDDGILGSNIGSSADYLGRVTINPSELVKTSDMLKGGLDREDEFTSSIVLQDDFERCTKHREKSCQYCIDERARKERP